MSSACFWYLCFPLPLWLLLDTHAIKKKNATCKFGSQNIMRTSYWKPKGLIHKYWKGTTKRVTLVYLYHVNRCGHHKKLSIAKLDSVQVCGLSLNFYNNTLRKFYKFSDSRETWTSPTLQSADWPISRQYHRPQMRKRESYPEVYK